MRVINNTNGWLALGALVMMLAGGQVLGMASGMKKPAESEFGLGPRASAGRLYMATLVPVEPLRPRKMQTLVACVTDMAGRAIDEAQITIDGGMPQHRHGLPTRPRVTRGLGEGRYEIEGVRFNMGGWWEFKLTIATPAGTDVVTFNLGL